MLGVFYLFLCFTTGWAVCTYAFPSLINVVEKAYDKRKIFFSPYLLLFPAWFVSGTLAITWVTYLTALLFSQKDSPLVIANGVSMSLALIGSAVAFYLRKAKRPANSSGINKHENPQKTSLICSDRNTRYLEIFLLAAISILACVLMWTTFFIKGSQLYVGATVFSDFAPHLGMIRSFSYGNNFPTAYSHFAGEDIKYHFMFQFLVGNLEFLGLRLDYAFNIPSILSFISAFLLLYLFAVKITGKISAGMLSCLFFAFRSSKSLFTYLAELPAGTNIQKALAENYSFIGYTPNEDWGLWNLNVYCNQRHLAFGLAGIFLILILFLPHLYEMFEAVKQISFHKIGQIKKEYHIGFNKFIRLVKVLFFTKEGWKIRDLRLSIASGILLGSLSFFNGAAVIGCLLVLLIVAVLSRRRLELLIVAVIAISLTLLQTHLFIKGSAVSTKLLFGFIAENKTLFGALSYLERLLGILPFVLLAAFCLEKGIGRYLMLAFTLPLIFAFTLSLTTDVTVNHKYIMMSCILLSIFAASLLMKLFEKKDFFLRFVGIILIIILTATGIYDFTTILKKNNPQNAIVLDLNDPLTKWINQNSDSKDIYLSANYYLNQVVFGGAMLYQGWQYYAWSAGYDTVYRDEMVKRMYEAKTPLELNKLIEDNKIRFIIVDRENRISDKYVVNEENISATYGRVYDDGNGEWRISIYDTRQPR